MRRLTNHEAHLLLNAVSALHTSQNTSTLPSRIFQALRQIAAAEFYGLDGFHPSGRWLDKTWAEPVSKVSHEEMLIFGRHAHEHPLYTAFVRTGLPAPRKTSDFVTTRQFKRTGVYNEFFRRVGVDRQVLCGLAVSPELVLVLSLNRYKRDFTEGHCRLVGKLKPHLLAAYDNAEALARLQLQNLKLQAALESTGVGAILFNVAGQEKLVTEQARAWLQKYFDTPHGHATDLPEELTDWVTHNISVAMTDRVLGAPVPPLEVVCADERLRIRLLIDSEAEQILLLMEEEAPVSAEALESLGLTKREAEVLRWVALRKTNPEIAILCGISQRTVHKHLEHIYIKLGVNSRGAAAQAALDALKRNR